MCQEKRTVVARVLLPEHLPQIAQAHILNIRVHITTRDQAVPCSTLEYYGYLIQICIKAYIFFLYL